MDEPQPTALTQDEEEANQPDASAGRKLALALLRLHDFRLALLGSAVLVFGFEMRAIVQSWLALELTDSQAWVGAVNGLPAIMVIALSLLGGVAADRFPKRDILAVTRTGSVALSFLTGYLVAVDVISVWHLLALAMVQGGIVAFAMPANQSIVAELVGRQNMLTATSLTQAVMSTAMILGPAMGGFLVGLLGVAPVYFFVGGIQSLSIVTTLMIRSRKVQSRNRSASALSEIAEGFRFVRGNRLVRTLMMLNVLSIFAGFVFPLLPVYARDIFEVGELGYGIMMTVFGLGGLTGTIGLAMAGDVKRKGIMLIAPGVVWLFGTFVFAFSNSYYLSVAVLGVMGAAGILYVTTINAMVQMAVPDELRGRVSSLLSITMQLFPIGFFASGIIAQTISNEVALMTSGIGVMAPVVMVFAVSPSFRALMLGDSG